MKTEIRNAVMNEAVSAITAIMGGNAIPARVSGKNVLLVESQTKDENGKSIFYTIDLTVKDNAPTKTHAGFNPQQAVQDRIDYDSGVAEKASKPKATKGGDPEVEARKVARIEAVKAWMKTAEKGKEYTATDVFNEIGAVMGSAMLTGSTLQKMVPTISIVTHSGDTKKYYVVEDC